MNILDQRTQNKITEEALHESVERFELAVRGSRDGLWDAKLPSDKNWFLPNAPVYFSPRFKQLMGFSNTEMGNVLEAWECRLHPDDRPRVIQAIIDHLDKKIPYDIEYRLRVKSGEYRWFSARGAAVWNAEGVPTRMAGSLRDITDRRQMEQSLFQADKIAAVGQLAAGIAHELNNPLHAILGYVQGMVQNSSPSDSSAESLRLIEKETQRCHLLVQNLLTFARAHKAGIAFEDPAPVADGVLVLIEAQARIKNIELIRDYARKLPQIEMDRMQIQQVLMNLCTNAMDAMPRGGQLTVRITQEKRKEKADKEFVCFEVRDNGEGISEKIRPHLFEPFFTTKEVGKGTGLGLSLVYEIVKNHHGEVALESVVGKGSSFRAYFPVEAMGKR